MSVLAYSNLIARPGTREPGFHFDGDFSTPRATGVPVPEYPFLEVGDLETVILRQPMMVQVGAYQSLGNNNTMARALQHYYIGDDNFRDVGASVVTFERMWANIPKTRTESHSFVYGFQILLRVDGKWELQTVQLPVDSTVTYTYFLRGQEAANPLGRAPRVITIGTANVKIGDGNLSFYLGTYIISTDPTILAEDDTYGEWKGGIRYRQSRSIKSPNAAFWGDVFS